MSSLRKHSSLSMLDANHRRAMIFSWSFTSEILEGRPVLNSSPEIETLLHMMALVLNRGMLVRY